MQLVNAHKMAMAPVMGFVLAFGKVDQHHRITNALLRKVQLKRIVLKSQKQQVQ